MWQTCTSRSFKATNNNHRGGQRAKANTTPRATHFTHLIHNTNQHNQATTILFPIPLLFSAFKSFRFSSTTETWRRSVAIYPIDTEEKRFLGRAAFEPFQQLHALDSTSIFQFSSSSSHGPSLQRDLLTTGLCQFYVFHITSGGKRWKNQGETKIETFWAIFFSVSFFWALFLFLSVFL